MLGKPISRSLEESANFRFVGNSEVTVHFLGLRKIADELIYGTPATSTDNRAYRYPGFRGVLYNTKMAK
jgi:hypothetical protein